MLLHCSCCPALRPCWCCTLTPAYSELAESQLNGAFPLQLLPRSPPVLMLHTDASLLCTHKVATHCGCCPALRPCWCCTLLPANSEHTELQLTGASPLQLLPQSLRVLVLHADAGRGRLWCASTTGRQTAPPAAAAPKLKPGEQHGSACRWLRLLAGLQHVSCSMSLRVPTSTEAGCIFLTQAVGFPELSLCWLGVVYGLLLPPTCAVNAGSPFCRA